MNSKNPNVADNEAINQQETRGNIIFTVETDKIEYHPGAISFLLDNCGVYDIFHATKASVIDNLISNIPNSVLLKDASLEQLKKPNGNPQLRKMLNAIGLNILKVVDDNGEEFEDINYYINR